MDDVMHGHWEDLIERATAGDVQKAREILQVFAKTIEDVSNLQRPELALSGPVPLPIAKYLAGACRRILSGDDPAKALNLVGRTRGRRKGKTVMHDSDALAAAFSLLVRDGVKPEAANEALRERLGVHRTTIQRARRDNPAFEYWKKTDAGTIKALVDNEVLKTKAAPYAEHLTAILGNRRTKSRNSRDKPNP